MAIKSIDLTWINVSDIKKAQEFFIKNLGLKQMNFFPETGWLEVQGKQGGIHLGVGQASAGAGGKCAKPSTNAVVTFTVDDIIETMTEMKTHGIKFVDEIVEIPGQAKLVSFVDSDGNLFQLFQSMNTTSK